MNPKLKEKITESVSAVLPITIIVLFISVFLAPMDLGSISLFLTGACLLVIGKKRTEKNNYGSHQ